MNHDGDPVRATTSSPAPLATFPAAHLPKGLEQARKIHRMPRACSRDCHCLCHPEEQELMWHYLGIAQTLVNHCPSRDLQLGPRLRQLARGLRLCQTQLEGQEGISSQLALGRDTLQPDVTDFASNNWQQPRRTGAILVLDNLQGFLELAQAPTIPGPDGHVDPW
ncbi:granulocyte colony-stimulating factor-like [Tachyglossus aculeatus]|uniref:granulocyte colony-stimulating factor-like n=1 Tax=Tachyglossus aculeatus TaxID=9261 RepID=UPI0018F332C0|nr:granulocyte colony-stimulating factor-like [Tachyglossus aculeatus]